MKLLKEKEVINLLQIHRATLWRSVKNCTFPKPIKIGLKSNRWLYSDIEKLIEIKHQ